MSSYGCFKINNICSALGIDKKPYPNSLTEDQSLWYYLARKNILSLRLIILLLFTLLGIINTARIFKQNKVSSFILKDSLKLIKKENYCFYCLL